MSRIHYFGAKAVGSIRIGDNPNLLVADYFTIGDRTYEFGAATPGRVQVVIGGTAALTITALIAAINANKPSIPVTATVDATDTAVCRIVADNRGVSGNMQLLEVCNDADNIASGVTLLGGADDVSRQLVGGNYTVTALDVAATGAVIPTGLSAPGIIKCQVRTALGAVKYVTDNFNIVGTNIVCVFAGATHIAATDVIIWEAGQ
jgi:hypothetical protein